MTVYTFCKEKIADLDVAKKNHDARCHGYHDCAACAELKGARSVLDLIKTKLEQGELSGIAVTAEEIR